MCDLVISFVEVFAAMSPWLVVGFLAAGIIAVWIPRAWVNRVMGGSSGFSGILRAVLVGVPLPICSCGVIPLAASLRAEGAGKGPTGAFFVSTPQTGIDNFLITGGLLGTPAAILRAALAFVSGLCSGVLIDRFAPDLPTDAPGGAPAPEPPGA